MTQKSLDYEVPLEKAGGDIRFSRPTAPMDENIRIGSQCGKMLALFRDHDPTNDELSKIARKYTNRISDLRAAGFKIPPPVRLGGGLTRYHLEENHGN